MLFSQKQCVIHNNGHVCIHDVSCFNQANYNFTLSSITTFTSIEDVQYTQINLNCYVIYQPSSFGMGKPFA